MPVGQPHRLWARHRDRHGPARRPGRGTEMTPADDCTPQQLVGKRVAFKDDVDHAGCWHFRVGLCRGVVLKPAQTLTQKAEMMRGEGGEVPEDWLDAYEDVPRVW